MGQLVHRWMEVPNRDEEVYRDEAIRLSLVLCPCLFGASVQLCIVNYWYLSKYNLKKSEIQNNFLKNPIIF